MIQRRMPSGQGPARGGARPAPNAGARPAGRGIARRAAERSPLPDVTGRKSGRYAVTEPEKYGHHRAGPRMGGRRGAAPARRTGAPIRISGRAAALGLLLLALILAYAYPLRVYLAQQAEIRKLESDQRAQREQIQQLVEQVDRWNDEDYVIAQARARLQLVRVGERVYVVGVDPTTVGESGEAAKPAWYQQVWSSVQTADDPPVR